MLLISRNLKERRNFLIGKKEVNVMAKDPVCGMEVDEKNPPAISEYKGKKYYFCNKACKIEFDKNPEKYVKD